MRLLVSASNELPDEDSGLDALYDRMLVRVFVNRIQNKQNFKSMLTVGTSQEAQIPEGLAITDEEYHQWQQQLDKLTLTDNAFEKLFQLKRCWKPKWKRNLATQHIPTCTCLTVAGKGGEVTESERFL